MKKLSNVMENNFFFFIVCFSLLAGCSKKVMLLDVNSSDELDDTNSIQLAIDKMYQTHKTKLFFPKGTYIISSIELFPGISIIGEEGTVFRKKDFCGEFSRMLTTKKYKHSSDIDSKVVLIEGITFDGNRENQGAYVNYQLEHQAMIFLTASSKQKGRLKAEINNCTFKDGVADAITVHSNVDVNITNCVAENVFRGGVTITGGYSIITMKKLKTFGDVHVTGIDVEVKSLGYNDTKRVVIRADNIDVEGDFDVGLNDGSIFIGDNITIRNPPFHLYIKNSKFELHNSVIAFGTAKQSAIYFPNDVLFDKCKFLLKGKQKGKGVKRYGINVIWSTKYFRPENQKLVFNDCDFKVENSFNGENKYVIYSNPSNPLNKNNLILKGCYVSDKFDVGFEVRKGIQLNIENTTINSIKGIKYTGGGINEKMLSLSNVKFKSVEKDAIIFTSQNKKSLNFRNTKFEQKL